MISMGDEVRRTQRGNNNSYCQDNEISWMDWDAVRQNQGLFRFWSRLINFRQTHAELHRQRFFTGQANERGIPDVSWHGCELNNPGWYDPGCRVLAYTLGGFDPDVHVMMNMGWTGATFQVPAIPKRKWYRVLDTSLASPDDIVDPGKEVPITGSDYLVNDRSIVMLISKP
jgi:isoamylase